jgi:hypothetical protein
MFYFENRELKQEVKRQDKEIKVLTSDVAIARDKTEKLEYAARTAKREKETTDKEFKKAKADLVKVKALLRQQTGADLLVNALTELGVIPKPEKAPDAFARQSELLQQMGNARQSSFTQGQFNPQGSVFSGLSGLIG